MDQADQVVRKYVLAYAKIVAALGPSDRDPICVMTRHTKGFPWHPWHPWHSWHSWRISRWAASDKRLSPAQYHCSFDCGVSRSVDTRACYGTRSHCWKIVEPGL